jgi:hypothetical protein
MQELQNKGTLQKAAEVIGSDHLECLYKIKAKQGKRRRNTDTQFSIMHKEESRILFRKKKNNKKTAT